MRTREGGKLHRSVSLGKATGIVGRKVVGRRVGIVKINEGIADGIAERVVHRATTLVPDCALVECDRVFTVERGAWV